jgi:hypothetical protein
MYVMQRAIDSIENCHKIAHTPLPHTAHGYRDPLVSGDNPAAWAQNLRVEIELD